ncbi:MAG: hypothetical protein M3N32_07410 [Actinomycetota bacterium]|nr:hypothetical protein [Actinomycetota bacterium]
MLFGLKGAAIHHDDIAEATAASTALQGTWLQHLSLSGTLGGASGIT